MTDLASATVERLRVEPAPFKYVAGAREFLSLVAPPVDKMPAAFVLPFKEGYGPNSHLNAVRLSGTEEIAVVLMVAVKPAIGADVHNPVAAPRADLVARLLGWQPDPQDGPVLLSSGELLDAQPTHLLYQFVFKREHTERA